MKSTSETILIRVILEFIHINTAKCYGHYSNHCYHNNSIIRVVKTDRIMAIKSVSETIPGLLAYSERHYSRVDR
jgi:hypothetical protein